MVGMNDKRGVMMVMIDDGMDTTRWGGGGIEGGDDVVADVV